MIVAVFADVHAHAEALDAVLSAAVAHGVDELWSLGDMIGGGPDPEYVVGRTRAFCTVALMGNHDYVATGAAEPARFGPGARSLELARERLNEDDVAWMRSRRPAARRAGVQCWHGGPRNPVHEYVGAGNAAACLEKQRADIGLVGHTHVPAAWQQTPRGARAARIVPGEPLGLDGKWLLNPGPVCPPEGGFWLHLDLERRAATWHRAPFDPEPARERARALGLQLTPD